jgi:aspartyl-tRNA(Asn)/glutamyl-tRNA(Gln) amidotransferase subunit C
MTVSETDVERVAELANLELTADEKSLMQHDLNSILDYVAQLNELETASVPPMAQVAEHLDEWKASDSASVTPLQTLRSDDVAPSLERERVLACAPDTDHIFFRVPKVIER